MSTIIVIVSIVCVVCLFMIVIIIVFIETNPLMTTCVETSLRGQKATWNMLEYVGICQMHEI